MDHFFFLHSDALCLVIDAFSPLTFKLNNGSYVFISILLIVWGFSIILFHFFLLLLLTSLVNWWLSLGLGLVISLIFCVRVSIRFLVYGKHYICKLMISNLNTFLRPYNFYNSISHLMFLMWYFTIFVCISYLLIVDMDDFTTFVS